MPAVRKRRYELTLLRPAPAIAYAGEVLDLGKGWIARQEFLADALHGGAHVHQISVRTEAGHEARIVHRVVDRPVSDWLSGIGDQQADDLVLGDREADVGAAPLDARVAVPQAERAADE